MLELFLLALALSADAFAVSIGLSTKCPQRPVKLAIMCAIYFGLFQALMPLIGYAGSVGLLTWVSSYSRWIAFGLLLFIGGKMIYEALHEGIEEDIAQITHRVMLILAIATSIDAMAAGFALTLMDVSVFAACLTIGVVTAAASALGVYIGNHGGLWLENKAELAGGVILVLIAFKMLLVG